MFWEVFRFECRYQLRSPLFISVAGLFFLLGFLIMGTEAVSVGGVGRNLNLNANFAIIQTQYVMSILGMFAAIAFVAGAITRDTEARTAELLYSTGLNENAYLFGRFAGGSLFAILVGIAAMLGSMLGTFMPWLDAERVGPFTLAPYSFSVWAVIVPNLLVICALFYAVAALTRSMMASYVAALGFIIANVVIGSVTDAEDVATMALFEPFGLAAFGEITRYWTVFDRNFAMPEVTDTLLYNRMIWLGISVVALAFTAWRYEFNLAPGGWRKSRKAAEKKTSVPPAIDATRVIVPQGSSGLAMLYSQLRMDVRGMTRSIPFYVLLAFGMLQVVGAYFGATTQLFGTPVYPVTGLLIQVVGGSFSLPVYVILIYYAGELVHREQAAGIKEIIDATPYPNYIMVLSKIGALWFVLSAMLLIVLITSILVQISLDYYNFEILLYIQGLFGVLGAGYYLLCIPAVMLQTFSPNKFFGMVLFLVFLITLATLPSLDFEHLLYLYSIPDAPYSAMNGWGHYVVPLVSFTAYCLALGVLMIVAAHLLYQRGISEGVKSRLVVARSRINAATGTVATLGLVSAIALGSWIFYNTNVLNVYLTEDDREERQADYEKAYKRFEKLPLPQAIDLDMTVDLFPRQRRLESTGSVLFVNRHDEAITDLHLTIRPELKINEIVLEGGSLAESDDRLGYYKYRFATPLEPGAQTRLRWDLSWLNEGFPNSGATTRIVGNGTFVDNTEIMPLPGYNRGAELNDNSVRRRYGLDPIERYPKLGDPEYLGVNQFQVAERTAFRATIGTSADQIAVAPGYLQRQWQEGGRAYFEYEMDEKIWPFVSFSSARYAVAEDQWGDVKLEVYYHPEHGYNIDSMIESTKKSLDYFSEEFSPYQYRQFRILEFPAYQRFAQSFPNTIPYSEAIGFIADLRDEKDIDYVFYVTAHETAHQWWGHQVVGANMQGMTVMVETLAQYSALMVMEREFGKPMMRRFLKYELDNYLQSRGGELIEELPLYLVENQPYIHYRKGSLVMYALRDAIGEDQVNLALRRFIEKWGYSEGSFPTAADLVAEFRAVAGEEHQELITDLFERIILFDLQVTDASVKEVAGGYEVTMTVQAAKYSADGAGAEEEVPLSATLEIGIFGARSEDLGDDDLPEPLLLEPALITSGEQTLTFTVTERPERVGVDPYVKMIDRNPDDNLRSL